MKPWTISGKESTVEPPSHFPRPAVIEPIQIILAPSFLATLLAFLGHNIELLGPNLITLVFLATVARHMLNHTHSPSSSDDFFYFRASYNGYVEDISNVDWVLEQDYTLIFLIPRTGVLRHALLGAHGYQVRFPVYPGIPASLSRHHVQKFYTWAREIPWNKLVTATDFADYRSTTNQRGLGFVVEELW